MFIYLRAFFIYSSSLCGCFNIYLLGLLDFVSLLEVSFAILGLFLF